MSDLGLIVALIVVLSFTFGDTIAKKVATKFGNYLTALFVNGFGIIPLFIATLLLPPANFSPYLLVVSVIAGFFLVLGSVLAYKSLETEQAADTWVFLNIPAAAIVIFGITFLGEHISLLQLVCVVFIFVGITMVTITRHFKFNKSLVPALMANISWTVFVLLLLYSVTSTATVTGLFFLVARTAGFLMLLVYTISTGKLDKRAKALALHPNLRALSAGVFDGMGQTGYIFLVLLQFVAIGAAISATEPALVAVLGFMMYREKLANWQKAGLVISVAAAVILGLF